ncbi:MAG: hypothetical protein DWQ11_19605 [Proteobacteria bacterium]|nr:MAG: hypothetical protein DWQ11_19605 [Pseudomonadota bacterium]
MLGHGRVYPSANAQQECQKRDEEKASACSVRLLDPLGNRVLRRIFPGLIRQLLVPVGVRTIASVDDEQRGTHKEKKHEKQEYEFHDGRLDWWSWLMRLECYISRLGIDRPSIERSPSFSGPLVG